MTNIEFVIDLLGDLYRPASFFKLFTEYCMI